MHCDSLYTSSFVLPDYPLVENIPFTSLCPGSDGCYGFATCLIPSDYGQFQSSWTDFPLVLLIIDVEHAHVEEHRASFLHKFFYTIHLIYDTEQSNWLLAIDAARGRVGHPGGQKLLDFYVFNSSTPSRWERIRRIKQIWERRIDESLGEEIISEGLEPWFVTRLEQRNLFPLLIKGHVDDDGLAEHYVQVVHAHTPEHLTTYELRRGHRSISFVFANSIMLFFCECPKETYTWTIRMSVFDVHGEMIALKDMTPVPYPARWEKLWVADDLEDWLWPTMAAIRGPLYGPEQVPTCVAALQLRDQPEKGRGSRIRYAKEPLPEVQGGLFCIDSMGQILAQQEYVLGEYLRMCVCGDSVIGVDFLEERWRLWSWSPGTKNLVEIQMDLQYDAKRVTLVPVESSDQYVTPSFWSIAEHANGIQVSLWIGPDWQSVHYQHVEHVRLPNRRAQSHPGGEPAAIAVYQDSLLIMVIDQAYRLQLLRFH